MKQGGRIFLYIGLGVLLAAFIARWLGAPLCCFWILLGLAVFFKASFLITVFRAKSFRPGLWLYLILAGVAMILTSHLFKTVFPIPVVRSILFYGAISLKISGLMLMLLRKKQPRSGEI